MFGGWSSGYDCDRSTAVWCRLAPGVSANLWRYDPVLQSWYVRAVWPRRAVRVVECVVMCWCADRMQLDVVGGVKPPGRERHVAAEISQRMIVFGGRQNDLPAGGVGARAAAGLV